VKAPEWRGSYNYYDSLTRLVNRCNPKEILVQGGEVLIQKKSMDWISDIKNSNPNLRISLVTNGNVNQDITNRASEIFERVTISFPGFQPESYNIITGMDVNKSKQFAKHLLECGVDVHLKFLLTPINIHESTSFLNWAISLNPQRIVFSDSYVNSYINKETSDLYWEKIFSRNAEKFKNYILLNKEKIENGHTIICFDNESLMRRFEIDEEFVRKNQLSKKIRPSYT